MNREVHVRFSSNGSVALPVAGYNYNSDWTHLLVGLSPTGMAVSLAAPDRATFRHLRRMQSPYPRQESEFQPVKFSVDWARMILEFKLSCEECVTDQKSKVS
jgi:hypothetical protein